VFAVKVQLRCVWGLGFLFGLRVEILGFRVQVCGLRFRRVGELYPRRGVGQGGHVPRDVAPPRRGEARRRLDGRGVRGLDRGEERVVAPEVGLAHVEGALERLDRLLPQPQHLLLGGAVVVGDGEQPEVLQRPRLALLPSASGLGVQGLNVQRFRGGLVFEAHGLCVSLNSRPERGCPLLRAWGFRVWGLGEAHVHLLLRLLYHSTLGVRVIKQKKEDKRLHFGAEACLSAAMNSHSHTLTPSHSHTLAPVRGHGAQALRPPEALREDCDGCLDLLKG